MIRATTPIHTFTIESSTIDLTLAKNIRLTYAQKGTIILDKSKNDLVVSGNTISYILSQSDTLLFKEAYPVEIQITVRTKDDVVVKTGIVSIRAERALNTEVFNNED